ncbi:uncharacterized protein [Amphiura filiformis]|uniref:uncharacterized protein n=1 Tax=Amphiura filiformis TaxID=82378 RepID=UPI003B21E5F7
MPSATASGIPLTPTSTFGGATTITVNPGDAFIIEYMFRDTSGNQATCAFPIAASVASGPQITSCPTNIEVVAEPIGSTSVTWSEPSALGQFASPNIPPGSTFYVGNTLVYYVFGDPNFNPSVCAFVVTVTNSAAVGRKKRDNFSYADICQSSPCEDQGDNSICIPCVRRFDTIYGYACLPTHLNESNGITCNDVKYDQLDNNDEYYLDKPEQIDRPRTGIHQPHHRLSPGAFAAITFAVCFCILQLFIAVVIICPILRNSKQFQQKMLDYEAKMETKKMSMMT